MEYINLIGQTPQIQIFIICFFGIFMGSLLNVINNRVPNMLAYQNALLVKDNAIEVEKEVEEVLSKYKDYNLFFPSSHCPKCKKKIHWYENIPVLSWLFLRGKCSNCKVSISPEYPIVELLNLGLWYGAYVYFGWTTELFFVIAALTMILSITVIDLKYQILPDTAMFLLFLIPLYLSIIGLHNIEASTIIITSVLVYFGLLFFFSSYESLRGFEGHILGRGDIKIFLCYISLGWRNWVTSRSYVFCRFRFTFLFNYLFIF